MNDTIGNTPLIKINYIYKNKKRHLYAKLEYFNLTGSIKDRVAYYMIKNAKDKNILKDNMPIVEVTSGNTGISLSALGKYFDHPIYIYMPNWVSKERVLLMENLGANITLVSKEEGGFNKCLRLAKDKCAELNGFLIDQFSNNDNYLAHYETTATEILSKDILNDINSFISGIGTGGTLMGVSTKLKEYKKDLKVIAIEPDKMPILSQGKIIEQHKIEGIGDDFIPELIDTNKIDEIITIDDNDSINMAKMLSKELGLGVGISSGANFLGAVLSDDNCITIFADDNKKYLSTDLFKKKLIKNNFISKDVVLIDFIVM